MRAEAAFKLTSWKGDGSMLDQNSQNVLDVATGQPIGAGAVVDTLETGDYAAVIASPNSLNGVARKGTEIMVSLELVMDGMNPGIMFELTSAGNNDDEKEISQEVNTKGYNAVTAGDLDNESKVLNSYTYDIASDSAMNIYARNEWALNLGDGVLGRIGIMYGLETSSQDFTMSQKQSTTTLVDADNDHLYTTVGVDTHTVSTTIWPDEQTTTDTTSHSFILPFAVEVDIAKGLALRVGSQLRYTISSTETVTDVASGANIVQNENKLTGVGTETKSAYTMTKTTTESSSTTLSKEIQFGMGWDINDSLSVDTMTQATLGAGMPVIANWYLSGTLRL
jgi:hypothetical protein